jgi:acyl carrier protein
MAFVKNSLNIDIQCSEDDLIETGLLDSLMLVELVLYIEQTFNVSPSLEDLEIENFATVSRMADFVVARVLGLASAVDTPSAAVLQLNC